MYISKGVATMTKCEGSAKIPIALPYSSIFVFKANNPKIAFNNINLVANRTHLSNEEFFEFSRIEFKLNAKNVKKIMRIKLDKNLYKSLSKLNIIVKI
jgi:hypothetical protein